MTDAAVLAALVTGQERSFHQDPLFAFRLLADIGLRALSPAINDPATAVRVLSTVESLLQVLVSRDLGRSSGNQQRQDPAAGACPPARLRRAEELTAGNFLALWQNVATSARDKPAG
jgi:hypothetical protein